MIQTKGLFTSDEMTTSNRSIHTPSNFTKQNLLYVQEVGHLQSLKPHLCTREKLDSFLFLMVLEGHGSVRIQDRNLTVSAGDCVLIDCMEHYEHISDEKDAWKLAWVHFNGHCARGYYEQFLKYNGNNHAFHVRDKEEWFGIIEKLLDLQKERMVMAELYSAEMLLHLLNKTMDVVAGSALTESSEDKQVAEDVRELINEKYNHSDVLSQLEISLNKPYPELNAVFQKKYGISVEEYIGNRRYNAAKEMLRFTVKPYEQVAVESGIGDVIAMEQMFRSKEEMTAEEYRRRWAGWIRN